MPVLHLRSQDTSQRGRHSLLRSSASAKSAASVGIFLFYADGRGGQLFPAHASLAACPCVCLVCIGAQAERDS